MTTVVVVDVLLFWVGVSCALLFFFFLFFFFVVGGCLGSGVTTLYTCLVHRHFALFCSSLITVSRFGTVITKPTDESC
jgi:hypothetical protein